MEPPGLEKRETWGTRRVMVRFHPVMLCEQQVVAGVCRFLTDNGFRITQCLATTEHGEDIRALAPDRKQQVTIEAKGATSSRGQEQPVR